MKASTTTVDSNSSEHWESSLDEVSGKIFYYNTKTNATQWEQPPKYKYKCSVKPRTKSTDIFYPNGNRDNDPSENQTTSTTRPARLRSLKESNPRNNRIHHITGSLELFNPILFHSKINETEPTSTGTTAAATATTTVNNNIDSANALGNKSHLEQKINESKTKQDRPSKQSETTTITPATVTVPLAASTKKTSRKSNKALYRQMSVKEEQERVNLHVLESLHAVGFSARSFRHRARDIVNVTNIFLLVTAMTLIMLVSYVFSRRTIDQSLSLIGMSEVLRVTSYVNTIVRQAKTTTRSTSLLDLVGVNDDVGLSSGQTTLLYLSTVARDHRIIDVRRRTTASPTAGSATVYNFGIHRIGGSSSGWEDQGYNVWYQRTSNSTYSTRTINHTTTTNRIKHLANDPNMVAVSSTKGGRTTAITTTLDSPLPCVQFYHTLDNSCRFLVGAPSGHLCCTFTIRLPSSASYITTSFSYLIDASLMLQSTLFNQKLQIKNKYTSTNPQINVRLFLHDSSLNVIASTLNRSDPLGNRETIDSRGANTAAVAETWCNASGSDLMVVESWRRLSALILNFNTSVQKRCSPEVIRQIFDMPNNGVFNYFQKLDGDAVFKGHLRDTLSTRASNQKIEEWAKWPRQEQKLDVDNGNIVVQKVVQNHQDVRPENGVELKVSFGADSKIESMRLYLLPWIHPSMGKGNGIVMLLNEIAITSSYQYGTLVLIPIVAAMLLLLSFGVTHLTLSLLGHNLNESEAILKTAKHLKKHKEVHQNSTSNTSNTSSTSSTSSTKNRGKRRSHSITSLGSAGVIDGGERKTSASNTAPPNTLSRRVSFSKNLQLSLAEMSENNTCCKVFLEGCNALWKAFLKLVTRWWLILVLFCIPIAILNSFLIGRGWSYSLKCSRADGWTFYRGGARFLSSIFRIPVAWMSWREVDNNHEGEKYISDKIFFISLGTVTFVASLCDFIVGLLVNSNNHAHVTYSEENVVPYVMLECFVTLCWFLLLPFVFKRTHTRRKELLVLESDEEDEEETMAEDMIMVAAGNGQNGAKDAKDAKGAKGAKGTKEDSVVCCASKKSIAHNAFASTQSIRKNQLGEGDVVDTADDGSHWISKFITKSGWDYWSYGGVALSVAVGMHVGVTHILEALSDQKFVSAAHSQVSLSTGSWW